MKYPLTCIAEGSHTAYLYKCLEELRHTHNLFVEWRDKGLTLTNYNILMPKGFRAAYPYKPFAKQEEVEQFLKEEWKPRSEMIEEEILKYRNLHKKSIRWTVYVDDIPKFVRI